MSNVDALERYDRLHGVQVARTVLREAFGIELLVVGPSGPAAHARGGVMASSSEVCRASLFSREGFARCEAFYREIGAREETDEPVALACHLGLGVLAVPAVLAGEVLAHVVASGFVATHLRGVTAADPARVATALAELDPHVTNAGEKARALPVVKGNRIETVETILQVAAREIAQHEEARRDRHARRSGAGMHGIVGTSPQMQEVFEQLSRVAKSEATVLVLGESGTGKELVARALHEEGRRARKPFVVQSCAAIADELLESTLFGHVRGAFSGAIRPSSGLFGAAEGGTLFLDEVGEMSSALQVKLLRVLQDGSYHPVGATSPRRADVRVIAASHRDLSAMVASGEFRQDLFYRLHVLTIRMPPLRERPGDLRLLVARFLEDSVVAPRKISQATWECLERYGWPGNVRELSSEVTRWEISAAGAREIGPEHLASPIREAGGYLGSTSAEAATAAAAGSGSLADAVEALERAIIRRGLERTRGNRTQLAKELGISRTTLGERLRRYGFE